MNTEIISYNCAASSSKHVYKQPIELDCKHCACKKCIDELNDAILKCKICDLVTIKNQLSNQISSDAISIINQNSKKIYQELNDIYKTSDLLLIIGKYLPICGFYDFFILKDFDGLFALSDTITAQFEFIESDIELRIESIKIEIDSIADKLNRDVDKIENKLKK